MRKVLIIACLLCCASRARAQELSFSSAAYAQAALAASPDMKNSQASYHTADNTYKTTLVDAYLPALTLSADTPLIGHDSSGDYHRPQFNRNDINSSAAIAWNLYNSGKDKAALLSAGRAREIAELNMFATRQSVVKTALNKYYGLLLKGKLLEVADNDLSEQEQQYRKSERLYNDGLQRLADLLQSETNWRSSQLRHTQAESNYYSALMEFNNFINREPLAPAKLEDIAAAQRDPLPPLEQDLSKAASGRAEMRAKSLAIKKAEADYSQTLKSNIPSLSVDFNWTYSGIKPLGLPEGSADPNPDYAIAASVKVPFGFFGYSQYKKVDSARVQRRVAENNYDDTRRTVRSEVFSARMSLDLQLKSLDVLELKLKISKANLDLVQEQYGQGVADSTRLTQAQSDYLSARTDYNTALYNAVLYRADYKKALGEAI